MTNYISFLMTENLSASFISVSFTTYNPEAHKKLQLFKITMSIAFTLQKLPFIISEGILVWSCFWFRP